MVKVGPQHVFGREICMFYGRKFPQNDPDNSKTENLYFLKHFMPFLYNFQATSLQKEVLETQ